MNMVDASIDLTDSIFRLYPQVVMEEFEDGALLLQPEGHRLFEMNPTAYRVLVLTDGQRSVSQIAAVMAEVYQISETEVLQDILPLYAQLSAQGVVEVVEHSHNVKENRAVEEKSVVSSKYARNPGVVLHEEDPEGGFLFNPDTNQVRELNTTGLFIWRQCDGTRNLDEIVIAVQEAFEETPVDRVTQDVRAFVKEMVESGFIGTVETMSGGG